MYLLYLQDSFAAATCIHRHARGSRHQASADTDALMSVSATGMRWWGGDAVGAASAVTCRFGEAAAGHCVMSRQLLSWATLG